MLAETLAAKALGLEESPPVIRTLRGSDLVGLRYRPPFTYARRALERDGEGSYKAWRCLAADFVNVDEGTGIVHLAGAFGADDLEAIRAAGIPVYNPVDQSGKFDASVPEFTGTFVKDADLGIIERLQAGSVLVRSEPYHALLSALLALQVAAALLRAHVLVHPHERAPRQAARGERRRELGPRPHQARTLRQLARE